ncbi:MAG: hypothetical protein A2161_13590 [Candidatus Schekmanbacteria bacterium RBG_13_48_7]|uniref:Bacterial Ig-like domain-containing protein n=1 Tax=Candidatus Schekmanbacteria bacterium RBG_13_48_7 TaxID=1817878 RepID=A0A1F7RMK2_9BACT|nr:MAG: hypothetical protein A2161_13590 [Candidatus Schekmanbacteria bacterium RBG_13_48_7]
MTSFRNTILILMILIVIPVLFSFSRSDQMPDATPEIFAIYINDGSGIDISAVKMFLDDLDVTRWAIITPTRISYTPIKPLDVGIHWVKVVINDLEHDIAGEKDWSFMFSFSTSDSEIDIDPIISPTNKKRINITGTTIPEVSVELFVNGLHAGDAYSEYSGRFTFAGIRLEEGENRITAIARDPITDEISREFRADRSVILDSTPPMITGMTPENEDMVITPFSTIHIEYSDRDGTGVNYESIILLIDETAVIPQTRNESECVYQSAQPIEQGHHQIEFGISDMIGNQSDLITWQFHVISPDSVENPDVPLSDKIIESPFSTSGKDTVTRNNLKPDFLKNDPFGIITATPTPIIKPSPQHYQYEPPYIKYPDDGAVFKEPEISVSGVANLNIKIQLSINNQIVYQTLSDNKGNFIFMSVILNRGENELMCRVTDNKGGYSDFSTPVRVTYEPLFIKRNLPYQKREPKSLIIEKEKVRNQ